MKHILLLLALFGVLVSTLALRVHDSSSNSSYPFAARWDCGILNHSAYSFLAGVPVAVIGIAGYLLLGALALGGRRKLLAGTALAGLVYSLYLSHIEKSVLGIWCLECVLSLAVITLITGIGWWWAIAMPPYEMRWNFLSGTRRSA